MGATDVEAVKAAAVAVVAAAVAVVAVVVLLLVVARAVARAASLPEPKVYAALVALLTLVGLAGYVALGEDRPELGAVVSLGLGSLATALGLAIERARGRDGDDGWPSDEVG